MINFSTTLILLRFALLAMSGAFFKLGELAFAGARAFTLDDAKRSLHSQRLRERLTRYMKPVSFT